MYEITYAYPKTKTALRRLLRGQAVYLETYLPDDPVDIPVPATSALALWDEAAASIREGSYVYQVSQGSDYVTVKVVDRWMAQDAQTRGETTNAKD